MPALVGMGLPRVSELVIDADLIIPAAYKILTKKIQCLPGTTLFIHDESGGASLYVSNIGLAIEPARGLFTNHINERTTSNRVEFPNGIKTDTIDDNDGGLINILESTQLAATKYLATPSLMGDNILDQAGTGKPSFSQGLKADHIAEYTASHGIVFDDTVTIDSLVTLLTQRYRTAAAGATSRYASAAEVFISNPGATPAQIKSSVTIPAWYSGATNTFSITFDGKSSAVSAGDEMYLTVNDVEVGTRLPLSHTGYSTRAQNIGTLKAGDVIKIMAVDTVGTGGNLYCRNYAITSTDTVSLPVSTETW